MTKSNASEVYVSETPLPDFNKYDNLFKKYGQMYSIPWQWLKAISIVESNIGRAPSVKKGLANPYDREGSKSSDGLSWGLMQVTENTASQFESGITHVELNDPEISVRLAAKYLAWSQKNYFPSDKEGLIRSYNGGPGWKKTNAGPNLTAQYYSKFLSALQSVLADSGQPEMSFS